MSDGSSSSSSESTAGMKSSDSSSMSEFEQPKSLGITIPRLPSKRSDDYYEVKLQFSRKATALILALIVAFLRLFEALGIELIRSIFHTPF